MKSGRGECTSKGTGPRAPSILPRMILIVANKSDVHTRLVVQRLNELNAPVSIVDLEELPHRLSVSAWVGEDAPRMVAGDLDLGAVRTVWMRRLATMKPHPDLSPEDADFARAEAKSMASGLAQLLEDRFWINPLHVGMLSDRGHGKLIQLERARSLGLEVPEVPGVFEGVSIPTQVVDIGLGMTLRL